MSMCVSLSNWTDKGIASFKESPERAALAAELARKHGGRMVHLYWTIGAYDLVGVFDMPDEASFTARALESGALGGPYQHRAGVQRGRVQADRGQNGLTVSRALNIAGRPKRN